MHNDSNNYKIKTELKQCKTEILFLINCLCFYFVDNIFLIPQINNNNCTS